MGVSAKVNLYEAKTHLSALVERAAAGEEIVIAKKGRPRARLVPLAPARTKPRSPGGWEDLVVRPGFDYPLPDALLEGFEGADPAA